MSSSSYDFSFRKSATISASSSASSPAKSSTAIAIPSAVKTMCMLFILPYHPQPPVTVTLHEPAFHTLSRFTFSGIQPGFHVHHITFASNDHSAQAMWSGVIGQQPISLVFTYPGDRLLQVEMFHHSFVSDCSHRLPTKL